MYQRADNRYTLNARIELNKRGFIRIESGRPPMEKKQETPSF